jgi:hypothetical protein
VKDLAFKWKRRFIAHYLAGLADNKKIEEYHQGVVPVNRVFAKPI